MTDDALLKKLADQARRAGKDDPGDEWDALAADELSEEERAGLMAADRDGERRAAAFAPLSTDFRQRVKQGIAGALEDRSGAVERPEKRRTSWVYALAASVVAALAFGLLLSRDKGFAPLPEYSSALRGAAVMRADEPDGRLPVLTTGERIELILTPAVSVDGPLSIRSYLAVGDGLTAVAIPAAEWSNAGAGRIVARVGDDLILPTGNSELLLVVGRPGTLPDIDALRAVPRSDDERVWQLLRIPLRVEAP